MTKLRAIIVDDEQHARVVLKSLLSKLDGVEVVAESSNLPEAIDLLKQLKPNLLFLDIEMPKYSGLRIAEFIGQEKDFEIVFVTAYNHYAINAFKVSAFDYLLKPIQLSELNTTLDRLKNKLKYQNDLPNKLKVLDENLSGDRLKKLTIHSHQGIHYFELDSIVYIEASGMYSIIQTTTDSFVASKPLKDIEDHLDSRFFRIHRSYIVNCNNVTKVLNKEGTSVILKNGKSLPLARSKKEEFLKCL